MGKPNDWYSSTVTANQGARPARTSHAQAIDRWDSRQVLQRVCGGRVGVRVEPRNRANDRRGKNFQWTQPWLEKVKWKKWKKWKQSEGLGVTS